MVGRVLAILVDSVWDHGDWWVVGSGRLGVMVVGMVGSGSLAAFFSSSWPWGVLLHLDREKFHIRSMVMLVGGFSKKVVL